MCKENAIVLEADGKVPEINKSRCLKCGLCVKTCPTGTIVAGAKGLRIQLAGKLGRHPKLARELPGIYREDQVLSIVEDCIDFYKQNSKHGERFAQIFIDPDFENLAKQYQQQSNILA